MELNCTRVGAFRTEDGNCLFSVWAPFLTQVDVIVIDRTEREYTLKCDEYGYWSITLEDIPANARYWFRLNHEKKLPDPASRSQPEGVHGPSKIVDTKFEWTDNAWKSPTLSEMILYEIHVGTFSAMGNFGGVILKLDHLQALGINAIELMPLGQFPGDRNWGYDGVYPFAVHHGYGGATGLKKLVDEAHHRGIAVILDVVYNHQGPEGNYLAEYGPYFTDKYKTGWGSAINFDSAWCDGVRNFYLQNASMWLDEFHIDGLRLDAVHAIWDFSAHHFIEVLSQKAKDIEARTGRKKVLIAEFDLNSPRYINPHSKGGYGLDGQWIDEFHHALHAVTTGEVDGYYEDFGSISHLTKSLKDSYVYTGQYSKHRKKHFGLPPKENPYSQFVVFAQNHDQVGNRLLGDRLTSQLSFEGLKLVAATVLLSPHVPLLFMGEEYGETNPFQYFISHTDKELIELVRQGRKNEFSYFNWQGEVPDPQSEETFRKCKLSWNHEQEHCAVLLSYYQYLISFRKERLAMQGKERNHVKVFDVPEKKVIVMERTFENDSILIFLNFEKETSSITYSLPKAAQKIFDSSASPWTYQQKQSQSIPTNKESIVMNPESVLIFGK